MDEARAGRASRLATPAGWGVRVGALGAAAVVLYYPLRSFVTLTDLPLVVRLAWLPVLAAAAWRPRASVLVFLAGAPLLPIVPFEMDWPRVSLEEVWLLGLLAAAWLDVALRGPRHGGVALPRTVLLLLAVATASLAVALYPFHLVSGGLVPLVERLHGFLRDDFLVAASQRHIYASIVAWAILAEGIGLLWIVLRQADTEPRAWARRVAVAAGAGAALVAAYGLYQRWTGENLLIFWVMQNPDIVRINATFADLNGLGAYLAMMLWVALATSRLSDDRRWRAAWTLASVAMGLAAVFTGSRAAYFAAAAGGVVYFLLAWQGGLLPAVRRRPLRFGQAVAALLIVGTVGLGALTLYATVRDVGYAEQRSYWDSVLYTFNLNTSAEARFKGRLALWEAGGRMVAAHPAFGIGIGRFYKELWAYSTDRAALIRPQENAHNYFVQSAAEMGLLGLVAWLGVLGSVLGRAWRGLRAGSAEVHWLALGSGVGLLVFTLTWLTGHPLLLREGQIVFWPIVAIPVLLGGAAGGGAARWSRSAVWLLGLLVLGSVPWRAAQEARSVNLTGVASGFGEIEVDAGGTEFRWTGERAWIHGPASARAVALAVRSVAPFDQTVSVILDGQIVDRLVLRDHAWRASRYVLPPREEGGSYRLELVVEPPWTAEGDPRILGVMVQEIDWME